MGTRGEHDIRNRLWITIAVELKHPSCKVDRIPGVLWSRERIHGRRRKLLFNRSSLQADQLTKNSL